MEKIVLEGTDNTPELKLDHEDHSMLFRGDSRPEDVRTFYLPILDWLENYEKQLFFLIDQGGEIKVRCNFEFEYFNSSSAKYLMDIITKLGDIAKINKVTLELNWHYDAMDEDMLESGEEFEDMLGVKFNFVKVD
jgi:hypothetical protein